MAAPDPAPLNGGAADLADALLAGPWRAEPMSIRVTIARGSFIVYDDVRALVAEALRRFRTPPSSAALSALVATWLIDPWRNPVPTPALLPSDPELTGLIALTRWLDLDAGELDWFADLQGRERHGAAPLRNSQWRTLPKRRGNRPTTAPKPQLKEIQHQLLR
ncbi:MAG: hypothetical protein ACR2KJ_07625, partial [Jatrophihabitans sp.]